MVLIWRGRQFEHLRQHVNYIFSPFIYPSPHSKYIVSKLKEWYLFLNEGSKGFMRDAWLGPNLVRDAWKFPR